MNDIELNFRQSIADRQALNDVLANDEPEEQK